MNTPDGPLSLATVHPVPDRGARIDHHIETARLAFVYTGQTLIIAGTLTALGDPKAIIGALPLAIFLRGWLGRLGWFDQAGDDR